MKALLPRQLSAFATVVLALLALSYGSAVHAQTINGQFVTQINADAGTGGNDQLQVTLELQPSTAFDLGTSTLMLTYNSDALSIPSNPAVNDPLQAGTDYSYRSPYVNNPGGGSFYVSSTVTRWGNSRISVNIVLDIANLGQQVPAASTPIVDLFFDIDDPAQTANLAWVLAPDPNPTVVQLENNTTALTNGTFTDSNVALPVELTSFEAKADRKAVVLSWQTASETNNAGFEVEYRPFEGEEEFSRLGFVAGRGTTAEAQAYSYRAEDLDVGRYVFRLKQVDFDGRSEYGPEVEVTLELAEAYVVEPAYPNPFNPQATVRFAVREAQNVRIDLVNVLGQQVLNVYDQAVSENQMQKVQIDGSRLASGLYFVSIRGERFSSMQRVVLVK